MSGKVVERGRSDCLLDCLREVRLQQFAGNFATRGVTDCAKLAALERQQFATYGVTSPADIRRLTRLITVIRDLRADGLIVDSANSTSTLPYSTNTHRNTAVSHIRRPTQDAQRHRRCVKRAETTANGQQSRHLGLVSAETEYDAPASFSPVCQRTVSHLPTHVEVRHTTT